MTTDTERHLQDRLAACLAENERLARHVTALQHLQSMAHLGSWHFDVASGLMTCSDEACRMFGLEPHPPLTRDGLAGILYQEDRADVLLAWQALLDGAETFDTEHRIVVGGHTRWIRMRGEAARDAEGKVASATGIVEDISVRKQVEADLQHQKTLLESIVDHAPMRIFWKDRESRYLGCNSLFAHDAGFDQPRELAGMSDFDLAWHDQANLYRADDRAIMSSGTPKLGFEEPSTAPDGRPLWLRTSKVPLLGDDGEVIGVLGIYDDITLAREDALALRSSEARFRRLFDSSPDATWIIEENRFTEGNQAAAVLFGLPDGSAFHRIHPGEISPEYQPCGESSRQKAEQMMATAHRLGTHRFEWLHKRLDGSLFDAEVTLSSIDVEGRRALYAIVRDITERKRAESLLRASEARLHAVFNGARDGIIVADIGTRHFVAVNPMICMMLGYEAEELLKLQVDSLHPPNDLPQVLAAFERHARGDSAEATEIPMLRKDGSVFFADVGGALLQIDGTPHLAGFFRDVTKRKAAEAELTAHREHLEALVADRTRELAAAKDAAETANVAKSSFLANMSHEIRTPLNAISGMARLIRRQELNAKQSEQMVTLEHAAQHLMDVINGILDLSKIESGSLELATDDVHLPDIVENVRSMLAERITAKQLAWQEEFPSPVPSFRGDATRLQQALLNYASNAVKFTSAGTIAVRIAVAQGDASHALVRFEVEDTGPGIAADMAKRLFMPFEQGDNAITRQYGGTGLGLTITRRIAQLMGGDAGLSSVPGRGSTFWFTARLERIEVPSAPVRSSSGTTDAEAALLRDHAGRRVLLAEDEPVNQEVARSFLEDVALRVDVAADGEEALALAAAHAYDVILMDMQMPRMDGLNATRAIRSLADYRNTPIIAMTANAFAEDRTRCLEAGMNDFLSKPFEPEQLFNKLLVHLNGPR